MIDETGFWMLELVVKSTLVLALAGLVLLVLRGLAAAERHLILASAVVCMLTLPFLSRVGPAVEVPVMELALVEPGALTTPRVERGTAASPSRARLMRDTDPVDVGTTSDTSPFPPVAPSPRPFGFAGVLAVLYLAVAAATLACFVIAALRLTRRARSLTPATDDETLRLIDETRRQLGIRRPVRALVAARDRTPWAFGLLRPAIVLPEDFVAWTSERQRSAVIHELSHVARNDQATLWLGQLCCALYWFQPLVWLAVRRMNREAEHACDDQVLLSGICEASYARQLLDIANSIYGDAQAPFPATAMARSSIVGERIRSILDTGIRRATMSRFKFTLMVLATFVLLGPVAMLEPQSVAQTRDDDAPAAGAEAQTSQQAGTETAQEPQDDAELAAIVESSVANDQTESAVEVLVDWITGHPTCGYCSQLLRNRGPGAAAAERAALRAAFDQVEEQAVTAANGEWLIRLAHISLLSENREAVDIGKHYLMEARVVGNVGDDADWIVLQYLIDMGSLEDAEALVARMREDASLSPGQLESLERWSRYLASEIVRNGEISARLMGSADGATEMEYLPVHKVAPVYPARAAESGVEGSTTLEYTVTALGRTRDILVVSSTDSVFDQASIDAAAQFRYMPRTVGGTAVEVPGVRTRIVYALDPNR